MSIRRLFTKNAASICALFILVPSSFLQVPRTASAFTAIMAQPQDQTISVIDTKTGNQHTIATRSKIDTLIDGNNRTIIALDKTFGRLSFIDLDSGKIIDQKHTGENVWDAVITQNNKCLYTVSPRLSALVLQDFHYGYSVTSATELAQNPIRLAAVPQDNLVLVLCEGKYPNTSFQDAGSIVVYNEQTKRKESSYTVGQTPVGIAVCDHTIIVPDRRESRLYLIDLKQHTQSQINLDISPYMISPATQDTLSFIAAKTPQDKNIVLGFDTVKKETLYRIAIGGRVTEIIPTRDGQKIWVKSDDTTSYTSIDLASGERTQIPFAGKTALFPRNEL